MASFNASGTDYRGNQYSRDRASDQLTTAKDNLGRKRKQDRIKESGKRSGLQKLLSAGGRAGLAYATGGASEAMGFGGAVDNVMLGTDSEGNAVRNEYGELVGAGSKVYNMMDSKKDSDIARKRVGNKNDYNEQVAMAKEVLKYDPAEGLKMLTKAQDYRSAQQGQTQKAEDSNLWDFNQNGFDDLDMTPSQIKGQEVAQERQARTLSSEGRRQGGQLDGQKELRDAEGIRDARVLASQGRRQGGQLDDQKEIEESFMRPREAAKGASIGRLTNYNAAKKNRELLEDVNKKYEEDQRKSNFDTRGEGGINNLADHRMAKRDQMDDIIDEENNKELFRVNGTSIPMGEYESDSQEKYNMANEAHGPKPSYGKTFSEKEAEALSLKDTDKARVGSMDDIALNSEGKKLAERYSGMGGGLAQKWDSIANPEDAQLYFEHQQREKKALEREQERTGGPMAGEERQQASKEPQKSRMMRRILKRQELDRISDAQLMDSLKNIGGINA